MSKKNPLVVISKGEDPYETTKTALQKFSLPDQKGEKVLIKPNAARLASPSGGVTTHSSMVGVAIEGLKEKSVADIITGESCIF